MTDGERWQPRVKAGAVVLLVAAVAIAGVLLVGRDRPPVQQPATEYPLHGNILATIFWVGEEADNTNDFIHNKSSAWTRDWVTAYGGIDDPNKLCDFKPCEFTPKENPFYAALPYNDLDEKCQPKPGQNRIYWFDNNAQSGQSQLKNRWIQISTNGKLAYAQIEDVGPFEADDIDYVFGNSPPKEDRAGLDLSPATAKYLGINGKAQVDWRFVDAANVPAGPWAQTITRSGVDC